MGSDDRAAVDQKISGATASIDENEAEVSKSIEGLKGALQGRAVETVTRDLQGRSVKTVIRDLQFYARGYDEEGESQAYQWLWDDDVKKDVLSHLPERATWIHLPETNVI